MTRLVGGMNTPALDDEGNVYYGVMNGYYSHNSPERLQNQRVYTDSAVRLNAESGELDWYYQAVTNDFWDWDLHLSPILVEQDGTNLAIVSGKMSIVYALGRDTGELVWSARSDYNEHDDDGAAQLEERSTCRRFHSTSTRDQAAEASKPTWP